MRAKSRNDVPAGCLYRQGRRWWWRVRLPGTKDRKAYALRPPGQRLATTDRVVAVELARRMWRAAEAGVNDGQAPPDATVRQLVAAYMAYARRRYRNADRKITEEVGKLDRAFAPLRGVHGETRADEFGPKALKEVRAAMVQKKWNRRTINQRVGCIRRLFRWASEEELVPPATYHGLLAVRGLRFGEDGAGEPRKVRPVADVHVDATLAYLPPTVRAMVEVQRLTGMRPGEVCIMRACDIDQSGKVWIYRPRFHKNTWRGHAREVAIGPRAQKVLAPFLTRDLAAYIFRPADAVAEHNSLKRAARQSKVPPSQRDRRKAEPRKMPGKRYDTRSYRRAISYAIERANAERASRKAKPIPAWSPNQLRHAAATRLRKEYSLDAARAVLGQRSLAIADTYAEIDAALARETARQIG